MSNNKITIVSSTAQGNSSFFQHSISQAIMQAATTIAQKSMGFDLTPVAVTPNPITIPANMVPVQPMSQPQGMINWFDVIGSDGWTEEQAMHNIMNGTPEPEEKNGIFDEYVEKFTHGEILMDKNNGQLQFNPWTEFIAPQW